MKRVTLRTAATPVLILLVCVSVKAQTAPPMAESVFKNVQLLKGISASEFMDTMGFFSASLGENCTFCHVQESGGSWARYADDNARKQVSRKMISMVAAINKGNFGGARMVTCYSCHRGLERPRVTPVLEELYGAPLLDDPDQIAPNPRAPSADSIWDKYLTAIGGAERLAGLKSFSARGTYQGFAETLQFPLEIFAKAPGQRTQIVHSPNGDSTTVFDGRGGWSAAPLTDRPVGLLPLSGGALEAARIETELAFPAGIKKAFQQWRVGFPTTLDDHEVQVVQGSNPGSGPVRFYFDSKSGLLVRQVRFTNTAVGFSPSQVDYSDYREVAGVRMPWKWTVTWLDGRSLIALTEVNANVPVDAGKFGKPSAPAAR